MHCRHGGTVWLLGRVPLLSEFRIATAASRAATSQVDLVAKVMFCKSKAAVAATSSALAGSGGFDLECMHQLFQIASLVLQ